MKKFFMVFLVQLFLIVLLAGNVFAVDRRFPVGLSYVSGFTEVIDLFEDNLEAEGYSVDTRSFLPVGVAFNPYVEYDNGFGVGAGVGPAMLIGGDADLFVMPLRLDLRYAFMPESGVSPYIRGGVGYNIASGDYVKRSGLGAFGAFGLEFLRTKVVGFGAEVTYDSSTVEFEVVGSDDTKEIQPIELMVGFFAIF